MHIPASQPDNFLPIAEPLLALAPGRLPNRRRIRYVGDDLCVVLEQLASRDQDLLRRLYQILTELLYAIVDPAIDDAGKWQAITRWTENYNIDTLIEEIREIGLASHAQADSEALAKAMHDVRGGALSALLGRLQLFEYVPHTETVLKSLFVLTRDHLKIMRSALVGLDEPRRNADRKPKAHAMRLILEKWHESVVGPQQGERSVQMFIDCRYEGALTDCCLESAAVDRIFYNLAAYACRHAVGSRLEMAVFPLTEPPDECLRFVLSNEVSPEEAARLSSMVQAGAAAGTSHEYPRNLSSLFEPEASSADADLGLAVVADFVAGAFGLRDRGEALRERYVGVILDGQTFRAWFHWPMGHDDLPTKLDDYHRPEQSLSEP